MSANKLKKSIGKTVITLNDEILELQKEFKGVKEGGKISKKGERLVKAIKEKKDALKDTLTKLEEKPEYVVEEKLEKTVQMIRTNIQTAEIVLEENVVDKIEIEAARQNALVTVEEIESFEVKAQLEIDSLTKTLSNFDTKQVCDDDTNEQLSAELTSVGKYQEDRFFKMKRTIETKMNSQREELLAKWNGGKDDIDHQSLKEIRNEFESTHRQLNYMVSEWDKRRLSNFLSDYLADLISDKYEEYITDYKKMDEIKRNEAAMLRKKSVQLEEYKREKRRSIPTWPFSLPYSKFKPDLISWDKEHYLTSGSLKFGLLAEMLKNQNRITLYEQIQTRLGANRTDSDIIGQVVALLDEINEETIYNKISESLDAVINIKRTSGQSLNDFFSKFETLHYSLNAADHLYQDPGPMEEGKDIAYYKEREKMLLRKVELNDKVKAVMLLKSLDVDASIKRDILSKIDFNKEPKIVYESTKTAIRDICSNTSISQTTSFVVKPWNENGD